MNLKEYTGQSMNCCNSYIVIIMLNDNEYTYFYHMILFNIITSPKWTLDVI